MPFKSIPNVVGPNYGGFIYGITLQNGYDKAPTSLSLKITNETGVFTDPIPFSNQTVKVGNLTFNGTVDSFEFEEDIGRRILNVTLVDQSTVLDKINVVLYKRNLPGTTPIKLLKTKTKNNVSRIVTRIVPKGGYSVVEFKEVTLDNIIVGPRECWSCKKSAYNMNDGGYIIIGEEEYTSNSCSIADSEYTFSELLSLINFADSINPIPNDYRSNYEGTLRTVLQNWCADYGLTFYWDYVSNRIKFVDMTKGISNIPDIKHCQITKKKKQVSTDGTFRQYGLSYYMKESKGDEGSFSLTQYTPFALNPYDVGFLSNDFGGGRGVDQFTTSAILANYDDALRFYYNYYTLGEGTLPILGIRKLVDFPAKTFIDKISSTVNIAAVNGLFKKSPNGKFMLCFYDESVRTQWLNLEAQVASNYIGRYYQIASSNAINIRCTETSYTKIEMTTTPSGERYGKAGGGLPFADLIQSFEAMTNFKQAMTSGYSIFTRGGAFSISQQQFYDQLGNFGDLMNFMFRPIVIQGSAAVQKAIKDLYPAISDNQLSQASLFFVADKSDVDKNYKISINGQGRRRNIQESSISDNPQQPDDRPCEFKKICQDESEDEERKFYAALNDPYAINPLDNVSGTSPVEGLTSANGSSVSVSINGRSATIVGPAESSYQGFYTTNIETRSLVKTENEEKTILWKGTLGGGSNVKDVRLALNNVTDDFIDENNTNLEGVANITDIGNNIPLTKISYSAVDFINELPLDPSQGLENLDITAGDFGMEVGYTYSTRPPEIPKLEVEIRAANSRINHSTLRTKQ